MSLATNVLTHPLVAVVAAVLLCVALREVPKSPPPPPSLRPATEISAEDVLRGAAAEGAGLELGQYLAAQGRWAGAVAALRGAASSAEGSAKLAALAAAARCAVEGGDLAGADELLHAVDEVARSAAEPGLVAEALVVHADLLRERGRLAAAESNLAKARGLLEPEDGRTELELSACALALARGDFAAADASGLTALRGLRGVHQYRALRLLGQRAAAQGDDRLARRLRERALSLLPSGHPAALGLRAEISGPAEIDALVPEMQGEDYRLELARALVARVEMRPGEEKATAAMSEAVRRVHGDDSTLLAARAALAHARARPDLARAALAVLSTMDGVERLVKEAEELAS